MAMAAPAKTPAQPLALAAASDRAPTKPMPSAAGKTPRPSPSRVRSSHAPENSNIPGRPSPSQSTTSKSVLKPPAAAGARPTAAKRKSAAPTPPPGELARRFVVEKEGTRRRRNVGSGVQLDFDNCREALRASQREVFRKDLVASTSAGEEKWGQEQKDAAGEIGSVKHLVEAFGNLLTIAGSTSGADRALHSGNQQKRTPTPAGGPCSSLGNTDRLSGGHRSRRNPSECLRSSRNKKVNVTNQDPFKLRTEQRGRFKEQQFVQKVQTMLLEQEKNSIHIAQGLPWTTDEPERLIKPVVKERTELIDLVLHSDVRSIERAEFDQHVLEKNRFVEQQRRLWERQQQFDDQEKIRQMMRTELIPKAQPMPYFDRPFIPTRSTKSATIPMELKFHPARKCYHVTVDSKPSAMHEA